MALQKADFILLALLALVTAALMLKTAEACSCAPIFSGICGYFDDADVVLHGTVLSRCVWSLPLHLVILVVMVVTDIVGKHQKDSLIR